MKKAIILLLFLAIAYDMSAQAQRRDTVVLSVYNNNQRFMLYPMPFGKDRPDIDFTAPMRVALDTVHVLQTSTQRDSAGRFPKRWVTSRRCGKLPKDSLTGKVNLDVSAWQNGAYYIRLKSETLKEVKCLMVVH